MRKNRVMKMVPNKENNTEILCPFFIFEKPNTITCEGVIGKSQITSFDNKANKKAHKSQHCTTWNYKNCPLYKAINKKYK